MEEKLSKSLETYLMAVDELVNIKGKIKIKDVAKFLNYGGAASSDAIKKLKEKGYVQYEPYENITITPKGKEAVSLKKYRHNTIAKFLNKVLDIDINSATKNAEAIEYSMTKDVLIRLVNFMDFMEQCTCQEQKWVNSCKSSLSSGNLPQGCISCKSKNQNCGCNGCCNK